MSMCLATDKAVQTYPLFFCTCTRPSAFFLFVSAPVALRCQNKCFRAMAWADIESQYDTHAGGEGCRHCIVQLRAAERQREETILVLFPWPLGCQGSRVFSPRLVCRLNRQVCRCRLPGRVGQVGLSCCFRRSIAAADLRLGSSEDCRQPTALNMQSLPAWQTWA
jgi:hypothetical protein